MCAQCTFICVYLVNYLFILGHTCVTYKPHMCDESHTYENNTHHICVTFMTKKMKILMSHMCDILAFMCWQTFGKNTSIMCTFSDNNVLQMTTICDTHVLTISHKCVYFCTHMCGKSTFICAIFWQSFGIYMSCMCELGNTHVCQKSHIWK